MEFILAANKAFTASSECRSTGASRDHRIKASCGRSLAGGAWGRSSSGISAFEWSSGASALSLPPQPLGLREAAHGLAVALLKLGLLQQARGRQACFLNLFLHLRMLGIGLARFAAGCSSSEDSQGR